MYARISIGNRRPARAGNATDEMLPMRGLRMGFVKLTRNSTRRAGVINKGWARPGSEFNLRSGHQA